MTEPDFKFLKIGDKVSTKLQDGTFRGKVQFIADKTVWFMCKDGQYIGNRYEKVEKVK